MRLMLNIYTSNSKKANKRKEQEENESSRSQMLHAIDKRPNRGPSGKELYVCRLLLSICACVCKIC